MLGRVANTIYWMNRYLERAENYARFMDVNYNLSLELPPDEVAQWQPLVLITGDWELFTSLYPKVEKNKVIYFLTFDKNNPNSILNCISSARENARAVRAEITKEVWEQINALYYLVKNSAVKKNQTDKQLRLFFTDIKNGCQLVYGMYYATISRNEGWHFAKLGQLIERADKTSRVLDAKYHFLLKSPKLIGSSLDLIQWAALLKSVSAYDMYRKKYGKLTPSGIAEFLILDTEFPRSILACLLSAERCLVSLSGSSVGFSNNAQKQLGVLKSQLEYVDINDIIAQGMHEYLDHIQLKLNAISSAIYNSFFSITPYVQESSQSQKQ
ncbi:alpha-E domain-containing protein [Winogradskyella litoriviva]|uniref:Alpha-E domain-containing protein n=1 Tax=Winogradskyella litoriviva TaxID=1220182 RepID=A0ABX2E7D8_9FLAO|nr:alpha-E domain-containing protein [Winogradskyella litoriviva]NRD23621.1 alpha-E domain-containing protein [Winogradskyella litoriviva]